MMSPKKESPLPEGPKGFKFHFHLLWMAMPMLPMLSYGVDKSDFDLIKGLGDYHWFPLIRPAIEPSKIRNSI